MYESEGEWRPTVGYPVIFEGTTNLTNFYGAMVSPRVVHPKCVCPAVAQEMAQWLFEHHDLGLGRVKKVDDPVSFWESSLTLTDLSRFLHTDIFGIGITPAECKMRELTVKVDVCEYEYNLPKHLTEIESLFEPLLALDAIAGFKMHIRVAVWNKSYLDLCPLALIGNQLKTAVTKFKNKGAEVTTRYIFCTKLSSYGQWRAYLDMEIGDMLGAMDAEWKIFMEEKVSQSQDYMKSVRMRTEPGPFDRCVVM